MADLREKRVELILQSMEELPTLPAVAVRVLEATGSDSSSTNDVVRLIQSDPALTARILQLVHRADTGVRGEVTTVERAVLLLGFEAVRSAVLAISIFQTFQGVPPSAIAGGPTPTPRFSRDEFWKHCVGVACCAELLAIQLRGVPARGAAVDPSEAFVCGLLHDMGKVALDAMLPKSFGRVVEAADLLRANIADLERSIVGLDHMVVGKRLAERWKLPASICECAWLHGQLPQALPATARNSRLINLITLADLLVREQHLGYSGNHQFPVAKQTLMDSLAFTSDQVEKVGLQLVDHIEPRAIALGLGQSSSNELYQQALSRANKELGRIGNQLASKNRKLAVRAKFFDALSAFQAELRPDAPPSVVLHAIGQTGAGVLDVTSVGVFSIPPGREFAETSMVNSAGEVFETSIVDLDSAGAAGTSMDAAPLLRPVPGDGPVLAAGRELEWLLNAISPRLGHAQRFWICLEADGQCIGGVVWGAPGGEAQRLSTQVEELTALAGGWALALRTAQIREEARALSEQLAEKNRQLQNAQSELLRSKTLVSVGEMAAGAAHEMNNPLAVISGRSQLLSAQLDDPRQKAAAELIFEQSHRLSAIITELMDFARPSPAEPIECDLEKMVQHALRSAKAANESADTSVEMIFADVPSVTVDPKQVTAALVEIISNALQAIAEPGGPENGDSTGGQRGDGHVSIHAAFDPHSARVVVTVADDGAGMDEATAKRAFDPFFSARPAGRRRGMGLAKALRWVEGSGGSIRLESRPGKGTRAVILLPAAPAAVAALEAARKQA